jgi:hypothetical protein
VLQPLVVLVAAGGGRTLGPGKVRGLLRLSLPPVERVHLGLPVVDQLERPQLPFIEMNTLGRDREHSDRGALVEELEQLGQPRAIAVSGADAKAVHLGRGPDVAASFLSRLAEADLAAARRELFVLEERGLDPGNGAQVEFARERDDGDSRVPCLDPHAQQFAVEGLGLYAPPGLARWSGPARPLHPLASTLHPLVVRCSHGAGSLQSS